MLVVVVVLFWLLLLIAALGPGHVVSDVNNIVAVGTVRVVVRLLLLLMVMWRSPQIDS